MRRRTRIVATLGPATDRPGVLKAVVEAGLDVARINFSHGTAAEHAARIRTLRDAAAGVNRPVAILADLPGPKLRARIGEPRKLTVGETVGFSLSAEPAHAGDIVLTEPEVLQDATAGHRILLDDGRLQLTVADRAAGRLTADVKVGGELLPNKGVNLPDTPLNIPALTSRDRAAVEAAVAANVDWFALSFVRDRAAADEVRRELQKYNVSVPVLAKVERPEAVERAQEIVDAFDGVMVARGDLGVEIPLERVPIVQKELIRYCRAAGKPVITATDMLDSMRQNPRPTRAEASDVANAIFDGTDAVMLSGETAVGQYPVESVRAMDRIASETELHLRETRERFPTESLPVPGDELEDAITLTAVTLARDANADAIVTPTLSGKTARLLARHRPWARIVAPAPTEVVVRRMALVWGLWPVWMKERLEPGAGRIEASVQAAFRAGAVEAGQRVVVLVGHPLEGGERLPTVRVMRVGDDGRMRTP